MKRRLSSKYQSQLSFNNKPDSIDELETTTTNDDGGEEENSNVIPKSFSKRHSEAFHRQSSVDSREHREMIESYEHKVINESIN